MSVRKHPLTLPSPQRGEGSSFCLSPLGERKGPVAQRWEGEGVFSRTVVPILAMLLIAVTLAGCGKKGAPSPPAGVPNTYPQNYPRE